MLELDTDSVDKMSIVGECLRARNLYEADGCLGEFETG